MWVMPDVSGEYLIQCREYCGFSHYQMRAKLIVEEPGVQPAAVEDGPEQFVPANTSPALNTAVTS
jgi:heme/copper-type cytochrome/quinol oxidase subunit 2